MTLDMKKLVAVMRMTEGSHDGEVLSAIRTANRLLSAAGKTWQDVIGFAPRPTLTAPSPDYRTPPSRRKGRAGVQTWGKAHRPAKHDPDRGRNVGDDITVMLGDVSARKHDMSTMMFIASLNEQWERKSYLTDAQYQALRQMHERGRF